MNVKEKFNQALSLLVDDEIDVEMDYIDALKSIKIWIDEFPFETFGGENVVHARSLLTSLIKDDPNNECFYLVRGFSFFKCKEFSQALPDFEMAIKLNNDLYYINYFLGSCKYDLCDYVGAAEAFYKFTQIEKEISNGHYMLGLSLQKLNKYEDAIIHFSETIRLDPEDADAYSNRGYCLSQLGEDSYNDYRKALSLEKDAINYYNCGFEEVINKDFTLAISNLSQAINMDTNYFNAYVARADAYIQLRNYDLALKDCNKALELKPNDSLALYRKADLFYVFEKYKEAISFYNLSIQYSSNNKKRNTYYFRGMSYFYLKNYDSAISDFSTVLELYGDEVNSYLMRASCYIRKDIYLSASKDIKQAMSLYPNTADVYAVSAELKLKIGDNLGAFNDLKKCLSINPEHGYASATIQIVKFANPDFK